MERLLGLRVEVELLAGRDDLVEGRSADTRIERDPPTLGPLPFRVEVFQPHDEAVIFFQWDLLNLRPSLSLREARVI